MNTEASTSKVTKNYYTGGTFPAVPTREEFHRYASNIISINDFGTDYPTFPGYNIDLAASSIKWTKNNDKAPKSRYYIKPKTKNENSTKKNHQ